MIPNQLEDMVKLGRLSDDVEVFGMKFRMRVLDAGDRLEMYQETANLEPIARGQAIMIDTLARAILAVNGQPIQYAPKTKEEPITREKLLEQNKTTLSECQQPVLELLYSEYENIRKWQEDIIGELKKKSPNPGPGPDGKSA